MTPRIVEDRDSLRKEKLPELAGWYRIALYIILLLVTIILCIYSGAQLHDEIKFQAWIWYASKGAFYFGLIAVASVAGIHNLKILSKLKSYDYDVGRFASTAEGASSIIAAQAS